MDCWLPEKEINLGLVQYGLVQKFKFAISKLHSLAYSLVKLFIII